MHCSSRKVFDVFVGMYAEKFADELEQFERAGVASYMESKHDAYDDDWVTNCSLWHVIVFYGLLYSEWPKFKWNTKSVAQSFNSEILSSPAVKLSYEILHLTLVSDVSAGADGRTRCCL